MKADIVMVPHRLLSLAFVCLAISILPQTTHGQNPDLPVIWALSNVFTDGDNVTLKCFLLSTDPVTFTWSWPHKLTNERRMQFEEEHGGQTEYADYLSFYARKTDNNKAFSCTSSSAGQSQVSVPFLIYVFTTPYVPHIYGPITVKEHSGQHTWSCVVMGATLMAPDVTWKHMGRDLTDMLSTMINVTNNDNVLEFVIQVNLTMTLPSDAYSYPLECSFRTDFARERTTKSQIHSVIVTWEKPRTYPTSHDLALYRSNDVAFLNCTMRANTIDAMRWNKDYLTLSKSTSMRGNYHQEGSQMWWTVLTFKISVMDNDRNYTCEVMGVDEAAVVNSDPVTIYVYQPPHIAKLHVPEVAHFKDTISVHCIVQNASFVLPTITWIDEFRTVYEGEVSVEVHPSIYENNLLVYEVKSTLKITLPKVHSKDFTCVVAHGYGPMSHTENQTATVKIIWDFPDLDPITSTPFYVMINTEVNINCTMSAQGNVELNFVKDYDVAGLQTQTNYDALDKNFVNLHWKNINFTATLLDNARFFQCSMKIDGKIHTYSESLIIFVIQPMQDIVMTGPTILGLGEEGIWSCKIQSASISVPNIRWFYNEDEVIEGVQTSVYTTEVPHYNFVHDIVSNLTWNFMMDAEVDVKCEVSHRVSTYVSNKEEITRVTVGTPETLPSRSAARSVSRNVARSVNAFKVLRQDPLVVGMNVLVYTVMVSIGTASLAVQHLPQ